jgi:hypothetical protein
MTIDISILKIFGRINEFVNLCNYLVVMEVVKLRSMVIYSPGIQTEIK